MHWRLQREFEKREVAKTYLCILHGSPEWETAEVRAALGVDPDNRKKFMVDGWDARPSHTGFEVLARGEFVSLLRAYLHTGRSHQIRVHAAHSGHPVVGDELYGGKKELGTGDFLIGRQALHSEMLEFRHPACPKTCERCSQSTWDRGRSSPSTWKTKRPSWTEPTGTGTAIGVCSRSPDPQRTSCP